ncbi:hypothetical protein VII00023_09626 [Vibrio ichthyoenteri ATCC 700023]|uniref:Lysozyme inhibitor LprI-like N-terminal domain-containing protein n=1 Tax=Vibrio ichthyoenteri ATCC 700023 TaxID=870968 RepID=F9RZ42_9VIBR|nr:lysozyme inhibitor LprI family protein [Vibrio ichthyoenteri]EGU46118.1 hypothetical protein VII00023_09626 [Vibrio ichthyoenteri ATCC 700023]
MSDFRIMKKPIAMIVASMFSLTSVFAVAQTSEVPVAANSDDVVSQCEFSPAACDAMARYDIADKKLNHVYQNIISKIESNQFDGYLVAKGEIKTSLVAAQRTWLKYRDVHCEAYYTLFSGGTSKNIDRMTCLTEMTEQRILVLQQLYL